GRYHAYVRAPSLPQHNAECLFRASNHSGREQGGWYRGIPEYAYFCPLDRGARGRAQVSSVVAEFARHCSRPLERWTTSSWHVIWRWVQFSTKSGGSLARWRVTNVAKHSALVGGRRGIRTTLATKTPPDE